MEEALNIVCSGTYDDGNDLADRIIRIKAIRLAGLRYRLLARQTRGCGCTRCEADRAIQLETEP